MGTPKPFYESWTLWFNVVSLIVAIAGLFIDPMLAVDPRVVAVAAAVVTVGNTLLRVLKTNTAIAGSPAAAGLPVAPVPAPSPTPSPAPTPPA